MDMYTIMNIICGISEFQGIGLKNPYKTEIKAHPWRASYTIIVCTLFSLSQIIAIFTNDLPKDRLAVGICYACAHSTVTIATMAAYVKRKNISKLMQELCKNDRFSDSALSQKSFRSARANFIWVIAFGVLSFGMLFLVEGIVAMKEGLEWRPFALWIPYYGPHQRIIRYSMVVFMFLPLICSWYSVYLTLIMALIFLRQRFAEIAAMIEKLDGASPYYIPNLHIAIDQHKLVIQYAREVRKEFRIILSVQLVQSLTTLSTTTIAFLLSERSLGKTCRWVTMVAVLLLVLGQYSFIAGEVTAKALDISQAVALSGWEHARGKGKYEVIILLARSQRPILVDAFGIFPISHSTFISILKTTYSVVAVMF